METSRILFIIPPYFDVDDYLGQTRTSVLPPFTIPYGILSLDAYLKQRCRKQVEVSVLDLNLPLKKLVEQNSKIDCLALFNELLRERIAAFNPDVIGLSALFSISYRYLEDLAHTAKQAQPQALVLAGGGLPSAAFRLLLESCPSVDAVCKGEGEIPLAALIDAEDRRQCLEAHPSWITHQGVAAGKEPAHTFIEDLDEIPIFDYEIIDLNDYNSRSIDKRFVGAPKREMAIHTSRGCPFKCVFCSNPSLHGRDVRFMSVPRVVEEVRRMKEQHGMTVLLIEDDHFFHDKARAKTILRELAAFDIRVEFPNGVAVYALDDEVAALFAKAGVSTVALAVESGSDYVLNKIIKKPLKTSMIREKVALLRKHNVQSHVFIVIGLPGELDEHRQQTWDLLIDAGFDWVHVFCAIPIVGSRLYDICVENGYIANSSAFDQVNTKSVIRAPGVDPEAIQRTAYEMNLSVNFVHNYNMRSGRYDTAIRYFQNVVDKYPDHAFGHYFLAQAYAARGGAPEIVQSAQQAFAEIVQRDPWWRELAEHFELSIDTNQETPASARVACR
ncbi:MAG: hypothetical protein Kow006_24250 [Gammaproteobacteria bacterium]